MQGKLVPIPEDNIPAVQLALEYRKMELKGKMDNRNPMIAKAAQIDYAAITWALDNLQERPLVNIGDGH